MAKAEHVLERRVALLVGLFLHRRGLLLDFLKAAGGRPAFAQPLTPAQRLLRFQDPTARNQTIQRLLKEGGPKAVQDYIISMVKQMEKQGGS